MFVVEVRGASCTVVRRKRSPSSIGSWLTLALARQMALMSRVGSSNGVAPVWSVWLIASVTAWQLPGPNAG